VEFRIDDEIVAHLHRRLYAVFWGVFNAGLFNISADGVDVAGRPREGRWDFGELHIEDSGRVRDVLQILKAVR
jgi:hypothetical protein